MKNGHKTASGDSIALIQKKIQPLAKIAELAKRAKTQGKTVVHCHGVFDLLHPGHIKHLQAAKKMGHLLIVTVTKDVNVNKGPGRPIFGERLRAETLAAMAGVNYVAINDTPTAIEAILKIKPDFYVKGGDYQDASADITGGISKEEDAVKSVGGKIAFTNEITFSSSNLINNYFDIYPTETKAFLDQFKKRYTSGRVVEGLQSLKDLNVLIIGEAIIDEYHYCRPMGKSPKESIVSTQYLSEERFPGGVLAAANHVAGFAGSVELVTCIDKNKTHEDFIREQLNPSIKLKLFYSESPTIVKRRFVDPAFLTKLFEVSYIDDRPLSPALESKIAAYLEGRADASDVVIVTDYGHGMMGSKIKAILCKRSKFLAVNAQTNSANFGFNPIIKYPKADFVCIDEPEIRLAMRNKFDPIEEVMMGLRKHVDVHNFIVTRGHKGSIAHSATKGFFSIPVFSDKVIDRVGAGDAYFSVAALCAAKKLPMDMTGFVGNAAGAIAVTIVCNRKPIEPVALYKFVTTLLK